MIKRTEFRKSANGFLLEFPRIDDSRGSLSFLEANVHFPFDIASTSWIYDVQNSPKIALAREHTEEVIINLAGSLQVCINNGHETLNFTLDRPWLGIYVPAMHWRELYAHENPLTVSITSTPGSTDDAIYDHAEYLTRLGRDA